MPVEGLSDLLGNMNALQRRVAIGRVRAAEEIAALLESWAKTNAPFVDKTGNLRNSIKGEVETVSVDMVTLILSAGMEYAPYVELRYEGRFAYLMPAIEANRERMEEIIARHCGG